MAYFATEIQVPACLRYNHLMLYIFRTGKPLFAMAINGFDQALPCRIAPAS